MNSRENNNNTGSFNMSTTKNNDTNKEEDGQVYNLFQRPTPNSENNDSSTTREQKQDESFFNHYTTKKTVSNGLLDGALLATNAAQLRVLLTEGIMNKNDPKWVISVVLISVSIVAQVVMLVILGILGNSTYSKRANMRYINTMNDIVLVLTGGVFCLNVITNVFIQVDITNIIQTATSAQSMWPMSTDNIVIK